MMRTMSDKELKIQGNHDVKDNVFMTSQCTRTMRRNRGLNLSHEGIPLQTSSVPCMNHGSVSETR